MVAVSTMWSFQMFFASFKLLLFKGAGVSAAFFVYVCASVLRRDV